VNVDFEQGCYYGFGYCWVGACSLEFVLDFIHFGIVGGSGCKEI